MGAAALSSVRVQSTLQIPSQFPDATLEPGYYPAIPLQYCYDARLWRVAEGT